MCYVDIDGRVGAFGSQTRAIFGCYIACRYVCVKRLFFCGRGISCQSQSHRSRVLRDALNSQDSTCLFGLACLQGVLGDCERLLRCGVIAANEIKRDHHPNRKLIFQVLSLIARGRRDVVVAQAWLSPQKPPIYMSCLIEDEVPNYLDGDSQNVSGVARLPTLQPASCRKDMSWVAVAKCRTSRRSTSI